MVVLADLRVYLLVEVGGQVLPRPSPQPALAAAPLPVAAQQRRTARARTPRYYLVNAHSRTE